MKNRLSLPWALALFSTACLALQRFGGERSGHEFASGISSAQPETGLMAKFPLEGDYVLVRTPDSEFLSEGDQAAAPPDEVTATNGQAATPEESGGSGKNSGGDGKEIREPEIATGDGKEFKEVIDPKSLPPIAEGGVTEGGGGGGFGGGGGGGGGPANEVAAFTEVREVESEDETFSHTTTSTVVNKIVIRTVPGVPPVAPVPEPGSGLIGLGVATVILASFLGRRRRGIVV